MDDLAGFLTRVPLILILGDWDRAEMASIKAWVQDLGQSASVRHRLAMVCLGDLDETSPDIVIVCQSWPDEFSATDVSSQLGRWPLALWACCFGAWCESDGRNRPIWPIGIRVPARAAIARLNHLWAIVTGVSQVLLPVTASRDEAFEFDLTRVPDAVETNSRRQCRNVVVQSPDPALRDWLSDLIFTIGSTAAGKIVLWDVDPDWSHAIIQIRDFVANNSGARVIAIAGLPHPELEIALKAAGADSVVTKAYATSQLVGLITSSGKSFG